MLVLLPPSETKRSGGEGPALDLDALAYPSLRSRRESVTAALEHLAADEDHAAAVLKLSARQRDQIADNLRVRTSPTCAAVDRYTGVLYDALDAESLDSAGRRWIGRHVAIHTAPWGLVAASDAIPAYRLAAGTRLPDLDPLRKLWSEAVSDTLAQSLPGFVLDMRSEAYAALGPVPASLPHRFVRIVTRGADGGVRALNHFNKRTKGLLVRSLAQTRPRIGSLRAFRTWADAQGWVIEDAGDEVRIFVRDEPEEMRRAQ